MKVKIDVKFSPNDALQKRGMGGSPELRRFLAARVKTRCDPYVPMQQGVLKNTAQVSSDGSQLIYSAPYARYQFYGVVMAGRAPKTLTGKAIQYHKGAPMRGKQWLNRMMADHRGDIEKDVAGYIAGRKK